MANILKNPSFEDGWQNSPTYSTTQNPKHWLVTWNMGTLYNNPHSGQPYQLGECVHKRRDMLPTTEQSVFVWDGQWTLKVFAGNKPFWAKMEQAIPLPAGSYRLSLPVWTDCYRWAGHKDYNVEPYSAEYRVTVGATIVRDWTYLVAGRRSQPVIDFRHNGGDTQVIIEWRCNWAISNNLWLDGWELTAVEATKPAAHRAIVVKVPQDVTPAEWQAAAGYSYQYRHTMTASHDDMLTLLKGGNEQSYVKLVYPERQPGITTLIEAAGYTWSVVPGMTEVTPPFP